MQYIPNGIDVGDGGPLVVTLMIPHHLPRLLIDLDPHLLQVEPPGVWPTTCPHNPPVLHGLL